MFGSFTTSALALFFAAVTGTLMTDVSLAVAQTSSSEQRPERNLQSPRPDTAQTLARAMLDQGDADRNGKLSGMEWRSLVERWFTALDDAKSNVVPQKQFFKISNLLSPQGTTRSSRLLRYLGLFVALDEDRDGRLERAEFLRQFDQWFHRWDVEHQGLNEPMMVNGFRSVLPRTNMGTGRQAAKQERPADLPVPPPSPVRPPKEAIQTIHLVEGFHLELAAAEPMIEDPVALSFDSDGRLYVVEMRSFMLDIDRRGERDPIGRISLLVDDNGDGSFDRSTVFLDHLILPRAVAAVRGGVLYVSDDKLFFARDHDGDGRADEKQLLDKDYGGGNVEHAPNGLMTALDNWIYNARSRHRYRWFGSKLIKQSTEFRGQWGITQDNQGRLFFNVNNSQLLGDYAPPNYMSRNRHHPSTAGLNLFVATDQRVFTRRMNTAVNRGYLPDVLDASGKLYVFASSCGPVIYRGDNFPDKFVGNAFVCDSAANLIKRNIVFDDHLTLSSRFAYQDREFLASTDERFRPVNLYNGPDGTLWAVDMYRGINQHGVFMTDYLRRESLERGLDRGIHLGRIYRIVSNKKHPTFPSPLSELDTATLVSKLRHPNGWVRDTAQRLLVERGDPMSTPPLLALLERDNEPLTQLHALWTLEGMHLRLPPNLSSTEDVTASIPIERPTTFVEVSADTEFLSAEGSEVREACLAALSSRDTRVQVAAIRVTEALVRGEPEAEIGLIQELESLLDEVPIEVVFQMTLTAGNLRKPEALPILLDVATRFANEDLIREAILTGLHRWELPFLRSLLQDPSWREEVSGRSALMQTLARAIMAERHPVNIDELLRMVVDSREPWQQRALLAGITATRTSRSLGPIRLKKEPTAFTKLLEFKRETLRENFDRIKNMFAWPGHQFDVSPKQSPGRPLTASERKSIASGKIVFKEVCAGCHGVTGEGIRPLAAPLADSDWVVGSEERLIRVVLHGLTGAVTVDGITYEPPIVLPAMPSARALNDEKIASVLSYIRRAWGHQADPVSAERVAEIRRATQRRSLPWTERELAEFETAE